MSLSIPTPVRTGCLRSYLCERDITSHCHDRDVACSPFFELHAVLLNLFTPRITPANSTLSVVADHHHCHIVVRRGISAELADVGEQGVQECLGRTPTIGVHGGDEPLIRVLLARFVHCFADAVAERDDHVAGRQCDRFLLEGCVLEDAEHHAAGSSRRTSVAVIRSGALCSAFEKSSEPSAASVA